MKRIRTVIALAVLSLILTSCIPNLEKDEIAPLEDEDPKQETSIVPSYQLSEENYKMILPFRPSKARGVIVNQIANRLDINEIEKGLKRHSTEVFDPKKYYFEEGQYITDDMVYEWLGRFPTEEKLEEAVQNEIARLEKHKMTVDEEKIRANFQLGLNPSIKDEDSKEEQENNPRYLSFVLEQNFLEKQDDNTVELAGISIGLALKSVYSFEAEDKGPYYEDISKSKALEEGKKMAEKVLERIRDMEELQNVPVMIALFQEEEHSSPVPGNYIAKTNIPGKSSEIDKWESIKEEYVLLPSNRAKEKYYEDYELINSFGNDIAKYFPNYVGVIGEGFYVNEELNQLTIEVPIEFYGSEEVVGFTQYLYGLVKEMFSNYYDLEIKVTSGNQVESLIYRDAGEEDPVVHIFH